MAARRRAAEPPDPTDRPAIVTKAMKTKAERERIRAHRLAAADPDNSIRLRNKTASAATWRDPTDTDVLRRKPKAITGFRATDPLETLQNSGTLNRQQIGAARRLRRDYESGCLQTNGAVDWERSGVSQGGTPIGISERKLQFLERFQNAQAAVGRLFEIVEFVVLLERTLKDYAAQHRVHPANASGRLHAAIEMLQGHYDTIDEGTERARPVHTIGSQMGPPVPAGSRHPAAPARSPSRRRSRGSRAVLRRAPRLHNNTEAGSDTQCRSDSPTARTAITTRRGRGTYPPAINGNSRPRRKRLPCRPP